MLKTLRYTFIFFKAQVTATDISEDMVAKANKTAAALPNMTAMVADAQNLHAFGDNSFDVVCNNSIHVAKFHKLMVCKLKNVHQPKL